MLYVYDIPFISMITSGLSCVSVYKVYFFEHLRLRTYGMLPYTAARGCLVVYMSGYCWLFAATVDMAIQYVKHLEACP